MREDNLKQLSLIETTGQSLLSLFFGVGDVFAGLIFTTLLIFFHSDPWIIALYPGVLSMRGVIGGLFCGRLSTGLHLGTIDPNVFGRSTRSFRLLTGAIAILAFESGIFLGFTALLFGTTLWGINILDGLAIFGTLIATMGFSLLTISPVTIAVAFSSFRRGLDPDVVVYPIVSTLADILVTLCYVAVLTVYFSMGSTGKLFILLICVIFASAVLIILAKFSRENEFKKTIKEALYTIVLVAVIVNITGSILTYISKTIGNRKEIFIVYPALLNVAGSFGAIVGSTATTKLALGTITSSLRSIRNHKNQIAGAWIASLIIYTIISLFSSYESPTFLAVLRMIGLILVTNVLVVIVMIFISFGVATVTFKRGLDPDNFVIPIESSLADVVTTSSLWIAFSLWIMLDLLI